MAHCKVGETMVFSSPLSVLRINVCKNCEDIFMYSKAVNVPQPRLVHYVLLAVTAGRTEEKRVFLAG